MTNRRPTFRFAPSPNGELHIGHALSALIGWRWARRLGGRFLLRIEDIDTGRARQRYIDQMFDDLNWLGLSWEVPVLRQSEHFDVYRAAADKLTAMGLLYPCFATRKEIAAATADGPDQPTDPDGAPLYPGLYHPRLGGKLMSDEITRRCDAGEPHALRLDMTRALDKAREISPDTALTYQAIDANGTTRDVAAHPQRWGDAVIVRKDVPASYHLAVVVDDARQGVTHVTRGTDLEAATDLHRLLQILLGLPAPRYHHHRLILAADGRKFSKGEGAVSLRILRAQGHSRTDVLAMLGDIDLADTTKVPGD